MIIQITTLKEFLNNTPVDITQLPADDKGLYYKDEPDSTKKLHQRLAVTYSPKFAPFQKTLHDKQAEHTQKMLDSESPLSARTSSYFFTTICTNAACAGSPASSLRAFIADQRF